MATARATPCAPASTAPRCVHIIRAVPIPRRRIGPDRMTSMMCHSGGDRSRYSRPTGSPSWRTIQKSARAKRSTKWRCCSRNWSSQRSRLCVEVQGKRQLGHPPSGVQVAQHRHILALRGAQRDAGRQAVGQWVRHRSGEGWKAHAVHGAIPLMCGAKRRGLARASHCGRKRALDNQHRTDSGIVNGEAASCICSRQRISNHGSGGKYR